MKCKETCLLPSNGNEREREKGTRQAIGKHNETTDEINKSADRNVNAFRIRVFRVRVMRENALPAVAVYSYFNRVVKQMLLFVGRGKRDRKKEKRLELVMRGRKASATLKKRKNNLKPRRHE